MNKELVRLHDGVNKVFITKENDTWKFFLCETYGEAKSLKIALTEIGNHCEIDENNYGWFVRVKK